jgi:SAM-dependent methyltransferase
VLEMACGTGRITAALAEAGVEVTGVDAAPAMLAEARRKLPGLRFLKGDMRSVQPGRRFRGVFFGLNGLMHALEGPGPTLAHAASLLEPGGELGFDVFCTGLDTGGRDDIDPQQLIDPEGRRWIVTERRRYDPVSRVQRIEFVHRRDGQERRFLTEVRIPRPTEMEAALQAAGLQLIEERASFREDREFREGDLRRVGIARRVQTADLRP